MKYRQLPHYFSIYTYLNLVIIGIVIPRIDSYVSENMK